MNFFALCRLEVGVIEFQSVVLMLKSSYRTTDKLLEIDWINASKIDKQLGYLVY